jgi:hypothetical protein
MVSKHLVCSQERDISQLPNRCQQLFRSKTRAPPLHQFILCLVLVSPSKHINLQQSATQALCNPSPGYSSICVFYCKHLFWYAHAEYVLQVEYRVHFGILFCMCVVCLILMLNIVWLESWSAEFTRIKTKYTKSNT